MRSTRTRKWLVTIVFVLAFILIFVPPLIGLGIHQYINKALLSLKSQTDNQVAITDYRAGWFSSDVKLRIKITDANFQYLMAQLGITPQKILGSPELMIEGHIQHGPLFYSPISSLSTAFGLAVMKRKWIIPPTQKNTFLALGIYDFLMHVDQTYVSFTGKFLHSFEVGHYVLTMNNGTAVHFDQLKGYVWHWPLINRIKGTVALTDFSVSDNVSLILLKHASDKFDLQKDKNGLWIGKQMLSVPDVVIRDEGIQLLDVSGIHLNTDVNEAVGLVSAHKQLTFEKLKAEESQPIGPFHLQVSASGLNAEAISHLLSTYQQVTREGEMYESQLKQKLFSILPSVISQGAQIQLDTLDIATQRGQFKMNAKFNWPDKNFSPPGTMVELVKMANLHASLRATTLFVDELINLISSLTYAYLMPEENRLELLEVRNNIYFLTQQNTYLVAALIQANGLIKEDGPLLLQMIQRRVSAEEYAAWVGSLFLSGKVMRETSYLLNWQYSLLLEQVNAMRAILQSFQEALAKELHAELNMYIQRDYIQQNKDDYTILLEREGDEVKLNGQKLTP